MLRYNTEIQFLKGVGPKLGDVLYKKGIKTVADLLHYYPRAYEDKRAVKNISSLEEGQIVSLRARVFSVKSVPLGKTRRKMHEVILEDGTGRVHCKYFRSPYRGYFSRLQKDLWVTVSGKVINYRGNIEFNHPDIHLTTEEIESEDKVVPLYSETDGLKQVKVRTLLAKAFEQLTDKSLKEEFGGIPEFYPSWILSQYKLMGLEKALLEIHDPKPDDIKKLFDFEAESQRRLIFDEFFWLELHLAMQKMGVTKEKALALNKPAPRVDDLIKSLPFTLTGAQKKSYSEIAEDLKQGYPMHRMVQGDVGCGKTLVALLSATYAADNGMQSCIMVPTEILAEQHYQNAKKLLEPLGIRVALLTAKLKTAEKEAILEALRAGKIDFCVGTHALIQSNVEFQSLGLVIIDEQHRFGVGQRNALKQKAWSPHFLVMTATPIPRTLAMTVYGDLDISVIDEMPPGRQEIVTRATKDNKRPQVFGFMADQVKAGRQAYIVYPLVAESEKIDLKNATEEFEKLKSQYPDVRFALLHGKMKSEEKESIMDDFRAHKADVLVSTTVIEVGVDVPNANMMIIEHAERFGLAQLHQLRGRVGRGSHKSYCVLIQGYAVSEVGKHRAQIMEKYSDGFKIAEADLEIRGPGEFMGTRQSGLQSFKMAHLVRDIKILQQAREAAFGIIRKDPTLRLPENIHLKETLEEAKKSWVG